MKKWKIDPISLFSHELKTPLSSLRLGLSLLEKDFNSHKDVLPLMKGELEAMIDFITDALDFRFIQEKSDLFQKKWMAFEPVLSKACALFKRPAKKDRIDFKIKKTGGPADFEVFIDPLWTGKLLENLISNALKFSPEKGSLFIEYGQKEGAFFFSIRDEGPGLPAGKKIFEPFYKSPSKFKRGMKNTGLGLSIAKAVVEAQGGRIQAFSSKKGGAEFSFSLPDLRLAKKAA